MNQCAEKSNVMVSYLLLRLFHLFHFRPSPTPLQQYMFRIPNVFVKEMLVSMSSVGETGSRAPEAIHRSQTLKAPEKLLQSTIR